MKYISLFFSGLVFYLIVTISLHAIKQNNNEFGGGYIFGFIASSILWICIKNLITINKE